MRYRHLPRFLVGMVVAGSLAACGLPGGGEPRAVLVITPPVQVWDLPAEGSAEVTESLTVKNIGSAPSGPINIDTSEDSDDFHIGSPGGDCGGQPNLLPGESCELRLTFVGHEPDDGAAAQVRVFGDDSGDVTANLFVV
ncbi:MAG TPA: hypothetical protein VJ804_15470 [Acidimicrobiales bacterium]|nr:hypothetical protein [Acidimicrobiales bacterium]